MSGNGKPQVSISTLVQMKWSHGDYYSAISNLLETRPSGTLTLFVSQGGIIGMEWTEKQRATSEGKG